MTLVRTVTKQSLFIVLPLTALSFLVDWKAERLAFLGAFGDPPLIPLSIIIGAILGIANLKGMVWGIEGLLGTSQANMKLLFLSIFRLAILFTVIVALFALKLVNLLGLVVGMTVIFVLMIREGAKAAKDRIES